MQGDKETVNAVHERDLENVLKKISLYDNFVSGEVKCKFCKKVITFENLHSIIPNPDGFSFVCDEPKCINDLAEYLDERDRGKIG